MSWVLPVSFGMSLAAMIQDGKDILQVQKIHGVTLLRIFAVAEFTHVRKLNNFGNLTKVNHNVM
jgi:hypothetical protein